VVFVYCMVVLDCIEGSIQTISLKIVCMKKTWRNWAVVSVVFLTMSCDNNNTKITSEDSPTAGTIQIGSGLI
jgi:hypothetical protein